MNGQYYNLAPYAAHDEETQGRKYPETFKDGRPHYERDRDRVIHCAAFRRLEYKTQVFVNHEGDYYRTRLTHSIEVAQIARGIARQLGLNLDLSETLSLAHDLGHTPFGHVGERILNEFMADSGGFEHNQQSLRVVTLLEERYPEFPGLNLTFESREGIIKHSTAYDGAEIPKEYQPQKAPTLEAQIINLADEIAYHNHDLDDGAESGLIDEEQLSEVGLWSETARKVVEEYGELRPRIRKYKIISTLIGRFIGDLVDHSRLLIEQTGIRSLSDVRKHKESLISFSPEFGKMRDHLRTFLNENLYRHPHLERMRFKAERALRGLIEAYEENPRLMAVKFAGQIDREDPKRIICDYLAGMTDRYALNEYRRLYDPYSPG